MCIRDSKISCCANSVHTHILNNTTHSSLLNSRRNNRAKNNKSLGGVKHLLSLGKRWEFGYVSAASQAPNKVSARHSKINRGRPGFHPSLFHTLQIKQNSAWNILGCVTGVSRVCWGVRKRAEATNVSLIWRIWAAKEGFILFLWFSWAEGFFKCFCGCQTIHLHKQRPSVAPRR